MGKRIIFKLFYFFSVSMTLFIVVVTIAAALARNFDPEFYHWMPYYGLLLPFLLVLNIILTLYWGVRRRKWFWFPLIALIANYSSILSFYQPQLIFKNQKEEGNFIVATYNLYHTGETYTTETIREIACYMEKKQVDILCLQAFRESRTMSEEEIETIFAYWPYYAVPRPENDSVFRPALFSRYPILDETLLVYPGSNSCTLICDIAFKRDTIHIFNNHLQTISLSGVREEVYDDTANEIREDTTREVFDLLPGNLKESFIKRSKQARILRNIISASPHSVIVCGDINDTPSSYVYRTIKGRLMDGFETRGSGYGYTYRYANKLLRIDYILYSNDLEGVNYQSPTELRYSRHNPVIMEFRF